MLHQSQIAIQVDKMKIGQIRTVMCRQRLRFSRSELALYLWAIVVVQARHTTAKAVYRYMRKCGQTKVGYAGFMENLAAAAPLLRVLHGTWKRSNGIGFDSLTALDSTLLETKSARCIRRKDWRMKRVTVRPAKVAGRGQEPAMDRYCGHKAFTWHNSQRFIVVAELAGINESDANYLKWPHRFVRQGLKTGCVLMDRGFSNARVRKSFARLEEGLARVRVVSPPRKSQVKTVAWSKADDVLYSQRWLVESCYKAMKDLRGRFRLALTGCRRVCLHVARIHAACWSWNLARLHQVQRNDARRQKTTVSAVPAVAA